MYLFYLSIHWSSILSISRYQSICLSLFIYLSLIYPLIKHSVNQSICLSINLSLCLSLPISIYSINCLYISINVSIDVAFCLSFSIYLFYLSFYHCLYLSFYLCACLSNSLLFYHFICLYLYIYIYHSIYIYRSICLFIHIFLSLYLIESEPTSHLCPLTFRCCGSTVTSGMKCCTRRMSSSAFVRWWSIITWRTTACVWPSHRWKTLEFLRESWSNVRGWPKTSTEICTTGKTSTSGWTWVCLERSTG